MNFIDLNTHYIGHNLLCFDELDSTNTYLKREAATLPDGTVVRALLQTAGKGRQGRSWVDAPQGGLAFSVLLKNLLVEEGERLPLLVALAVADAIQEATNCGAELQIKWPNDILLKGKKICGILCEAVFFAKQAFFVCGIGLNISQPSSFFMQQNLPYGGSILTQTGEELCVATIAQAILEQLEQRLEQCRQSGFAAMRAEYATQCINIGKEVLMIQEGKDFSGIALEIDDQGRLLCFADGKIVPVFSGEVSVRGLYGVL